MNGSDFAHILVAGDLFGVEREIAILRAASTPANIAGVGGGGLWSTIISQATIAGKTRVLRMKCSPLPFSIGTNADPFLTPAWPWTYQRIANDLDAVLPTKRMCMLVAKQADIRISPRPYPTNNADGKPDGGKYNESSARYVQSDTTILKDLTAEKEYSPGKLVSGAKKDVVVGPGLDGKYVAIFGWFHRSGNGNDAPADRWQPYSTIHTSDYADYSHGWRVFRRKADLDGDVVDLNDIATDKLLHVLVSDQGPFPLLFPNKLPSAPPPPGFPPSGSKVGDSSPPSTKKSGVVGAALLGGSVGFFVGGPVGAAFGAVLGGALGRA